VAHSLCDRIHSFTRSATIAARFQYVKDVLRHSANLTHSKEDTHMPVWLMALEGVLAGLQALAPVVQKIVDAIDSTHPAAPAAASAQTNLLATIKSIGNAVNAAK